jgi:ATP-dependent exoDNAse (exonuclease V) beta subunit
MQRKQIDDYRYYEVDGKLYPSVTSILSCLAKPPQLIKWIADVGYNESQKVLKKAGARGTRVHEAIESILLEDGVKYKLKGDEPKLVEQFNKWMEEYKPQIEQTEGTLYSKNHEFAGTTDLIAIIDKRRVLIDFKTSTRVQKVYGLQLAAYKKAYEEMTGLEIDDCYVLHLREKGYTFKKMDEPFVVFLALLHTFNWQQKKT